ncbi:hypothetical protein P3339_14530 [Microbulbifer sp. MLAF003]|uniref:hypothetical protein n=1 Tax=Microbulbifer sp. MLAF003 TaxID=3032582 RepID=UPI0024AD8AE6|nr:hypothetical protein [Microbulbifer sp. MLAF003]WHI49685.1 hypothetical protein P3339_14530 [Microbulbifer sp. MLAF003]
MDKSIRIGHIALSFHEASALEVAKILQSYGHEVSFKSASHEAAFDMLKKGKSIYWLRHGCRPATKST